MLTNINGSSLFDINVKGSLSGDDENIDDIFTAFAVNDDDKYLWPTSPTPSEQLKRLQRHANNAAASKYRMKKRKEKQELFKECEHYATKNEVMKNKINEIQFKIDTIKNLLITAFLTKHKNNNDSNINIINMLKSNTL